MLDIILSAIQLYQVVRKTVSRAWNTEKDEIFQREISNLLKRKVREIKVGKYMRLHITIRSY